MVKWSYRYRKTTEERQLKNHIKSAHEGHKCDSCDKSFTHSTFLKRHYQTVHQGLKDYNY